MWHKGSVGTVHPEGTAEPFVSISNFRFATPQFGRSAVVITDNPGGVTRIDGDRSQIEQGSVAVFAFRDVLNGAVRSRKTIRRHGKLQNSE